MTPVLRLWKIIDIHDVFVVNASDRRYAGAHAVIISALINQRQSAIHLTANHRFFLHQSLMK
jgi:hypothetical protein